MLKCIHANWSNDEVFYIEKELIWHRWPFVYLHGEAERMNFSAWNDGGEAPDICMANMSMDQFVPCIGNSLPCQSWKGTVSIPCEVNGQAAVCVLSNDRLGNLFGGRIALVKDFTALQHVMQTKDWR